MLPVFTLGITPLLSNVDIIFLFNGYQAVKERFNFMQDLTSDTV